MSNQATPADPDRLLVGDVGGTKTDLAVVSRRGGPRQMLAQRRYASRDYDGLEDVVRVFLAEVGLDVQAACFDVPGPVAEGEAELTNLPWRLRESDLAPALGLRRVWLLNDLVATAAAVPHLRPDELAVLQQGEPLPGGAIAVLAPGTGLGEAFLTFGADGYRPQPSEGGHSSFAPNSELELELLRHLWGRFEHVSFERVASGIGIPNLYEFLRNVRGTPESASLAAALDGSDDRTRLIVDAATEACKAAPMPPLDILTTDVYADGGFAWRN